jgi:hypothetical protein
LSAASPPAEAPIPTSMMWGNGSSFRGMAGAGNPSEWAQSQGKSLALLPACYAYPPYGDNSMSRQALLAVARHRHSGALQSRVGRSDPGRFCHLTSPHRGGSLHGHPPFARTPVQVMPSNIRVCGRWRSATRNVEARRVPTPSRALGSDRRALKTGRISLARRRTGTLCPELRIPSAEDLLKLLVEHPGAARER